MIPGGRRGVGRVVLVEGESRKVCVCFGSCEEVYFGASARLWKQFASA